VGGGRWHVGLEHPAATEAELAALLEVFEVRETEVKEHGHASTDIPSGEIAALLESIGISCSSGELEALYAQLQQVAGRIGEIDHLFIYSHTLTIDIELQTFSLCTLQHPPAISSLPSPPPAPKDIAALIVATASRIIQQRSANLRKATPSTTQPNA
jgi:hypothetical protein